MLRTLRRWTSDLQSWWWWRRNYTPDRHVLEEVIFPALHERPGVQSLLLVGCARYTRHYSKLFPQREVWTLDPDPEAARYGSSHHIADSITNVASHVEPASFDAVILNGVLGYGLDELQDVEKALDQCFQCLRPGGLLVVGWDDSVTVFLDSIDNLGRFERTILSGFSAPRYPTFSSTNHTFDFYIRPAGDG
jgi:SAM-dependent methyltransferase